MSIFSRKRSAVSFLYGGIALVTAVTSAIYTVFSFNYGILSVPVLLCSLAATLISALLCFRDTSADSYLEVAVSASLSLALALFAVSCVGDYTDAITKVIMFGSGAPIGGIIVIDILMSASLLASFIGAGFRKGEAEKPTAEELAARKHQSGMKKALIPVAVAVCIAIAAFLTISRVSVSHSYSIEKAVSEHGSFTFEMKGEEVDRAEEGDVVTVLVAPEDGFIFNAISAVNGEEKLVTFKSGENQYSFTMPAGKVEVSVMFGYKPTIYTPDDSVRAQTTGFSDASLSTYADGTFEYTLVTTAQEYGATQTRTSCYEGTWSMEGETIVLSADAKHDTYSFTHPRAEAAKGAYDQFCAEREGEITDRLDKANTAYINCGEYSEVLRLTLSESSMTFGIPE